MQKAPLARMKETFGDKEKLVEAIVGMIELGEETKDQAKVRLLSASNAKLLRLHAVAKEVKDKFGTKDKLLEAVVAQLGRAKDKDYRQALTRHTTARLLDLYRAAGRSAKRTAKTAAATAKATTKKAATTVKKVASVAAKKPAGKKAK